LSRAIEPAVAFYISGHGFGHATRQAAIIKALRTLVPTLPIVIRTSAPSWLFRSVSPEALTVLPGETDTGVAQIDGLHPDDRATIARALAFHAGIDQRVSAEAAILRQHQVRLVVADAPPLACLAAAKAGVEAVVCANFTWDWIYEEYGDVSSDVGPLVDAIQALYATAAAGWRLPMHGGFGTVPATTDIPFVARHRRTELTPAMVRERLGLPAGRPLALISFGGYGVRDLPLDRLDCLAAWGIVLTAGPSDMLPAIPDIIGLPEDRIYSQGLGYEDLVAAVDTIITKPGYGIISDCLAGGTAMLYTPRGRFREYGVLVREMPRYLRCRPLEMDDFLAGRWLEGLEKLAGQALPPEVPDLTGAEAAARLILDGVNS
jgi:L-arabinokinase